MYQSCDILYMAQKMLDINLEYQEGDINLFLLKKREKKVFLLILLRLLVIYLHVPY